MESYDQGYIGRYIPKRTANKNLNFHDKSLPDDAVRGVIKKRRLISKVGNCHQPTIRAQPREVDAVPFSKNMIGENSTSISSNEVRSKSHALHSSSTPLLLEKDNECSVASCSGNNLPGYTIQNTKNHSKKLHSCFSDGTMSSCLLKTWKSYPNVSEDELAANIHMLELHAYQSTMQALYASGPLSWEQESLLTNLRLSLHISNEEHLIQLRHLLSE